MAGPLPLIINMRRLLLLMLACLLSSVTADAAITQTGSLLQFNPSNANSGTVSSTITVPADAQIVLVGISGYNGATANFFSGGSMTFTKGGVDTAMTVAVTGANGGDNSTAAFMCAMYYMVSPDTGSNKTLKWDWAGANTADNAPLVSVIFFTGVETTSAVRSALGKQAAGVPFTTGTLTAQSGDLAVATVGAFAASEGTADTWSNLSTLSQMTIYGSSDGAWGSGSPSGNETVALSTATNFADGGIVAIILIPTASAASTSHNLTLLGVGQ